MLIYVHAFNSHARKKALGLGSLVGKREKKTSTQTQLEFLSLSISLATDRSLAARFT